MNSQKARRIQQDTASSRPTPSQNYPNTPSPSPLKAPKKYDMEQINDLLSNLELFSKTERQTRQENNQLAQGTRSERTLDQVDDDFFFDSQDLPCSQKDLNDLFQAVEPTTPSTSTQAPPLPPTPISSDTSVAIQSIQDLLKYTKSLEEELRRKNGRLQSLERSKCWLRARLNKLERQAKACVNCKHL
jgi:hypothetical protein